MQTGIKSAGGRFHPLFEGGATVGIAFRVFGICREPAFFDSLNLFFDFLDAPEAAE